MKIIDDIMNDTVNDITIGTVIDIINIVKDTVIDLMNYIVNDLMNNTVIDIMNDISDDIL